MHATTQISQFDRELVDIDAFSGQHSPPGYGANDRPRFMTYLRRKKSTFHQKFFPLKWAKFAPQVRRLYQLAPRTSPHAAKLRGDV